MNCNKINPSTFMIQSKHLVTVDQHLLTCVNMQNYKINKARLKSKYYSGEKNLFDPVNKK